jgi:hypothetical protein
MKEQDGTWVDVTGECEVQSSLGCGGGLCLNLSHNSEGIQIIDRDGRVRPTKYRWHWDGDDPDANELRIERFIPAPKPALKWTAESVAAVDWSKQTAIYTVRASWEHNAELDAAGIYDTRGRSTCPTCQKYGAMNTCVGVCPLSDGRPDKCCGGLWGSYMANKCPKTARAMTAYIKAVLDRLEAEAAAKQKWEPKLWEWVWWQGFQVRVIALPEHTKDAKYLIAYKDGSGDDSAPLDELNPYTEK